MIAFAIRLDLAEFEGVNLEHCLQWLGLDFEGYLRKS